MSERSANLVVGFVFLFVIPVVVVWSLDALGVWGLSHALAFWAGLAMAFGLDMVRPEIRRLSPYHEVSEA